MPDKDKTKTEFLDQINQFLQDHSVKGLGKSLRLVLFGYLRNMKEGLPIEFDEVIDDMEVLFELLDLMQVEKKGK